MSEKSFGRRPTHCFLSTFKLKNYGFALGERRIGKASKRHHPSSFFRLKSPQVVEYEFRGHFGHPSSYAFVKFECLPATHLTFEAKATWPSTLTEEYIRSCEVSIAAAVADVLLQGEYPRRGCSVVLSEVRWDDIGGSAHAFRRAATAAMENLVKGKGEWSA